MKSSMKGSVKAMNGEIKKVVAAVKDAQVQLQTVLKDRSWIDDARKYAERQGKELKKLLSSDMDRVVAFVESERKELERFQRQIPGEVKKLKKFVDAQKKDLEKLLVNLRKNAKPAAAKGRARKTKVTKPAAAKATSARKKAAKPRATAASEAETSQA
jgi:hypothetical protein